MSRVYPAWPCFACVCNALEPPGRPLLHQGKSITLRLFGNKLAFPRSASTVHSGLLESGFSNGSIRAQSGKGAGSGDRGCDQQTGCDQQGGRGQQNGENPVHDLFLQVRFVPEKLSISRGCRRVELLPSLRVTYARSNPGRKGTGRQAAPCRPTIKACGCNFGGSGGNVSVSPRGIGPSFASCGSGTGIM